MHLISRRFWSLAALVVILAGLGSAGVVAYGRMLRGDIDIAGAPADLPRRAAPAPVKQRPGIKYALDCRLQLNDWHEGRERRIVHEGREYPYDLWAYADVTLDQKKSSVSSRALNWHWIAAIAKEDPAQGEDPILEIPLATPPADAFSTEGHAVYSSAAMGDDGMPSYSVTASVKLPVGAYYLSAFGTEGGDLREPLQVRAETSIPRSSVPNPAGEPDRLSRLLHVYCTKKP